MLLLENAVYANSSSTSHSNEKLNNTRKRLNGNHPISPKDLSALARLKYFTSVTQKISEKL